MMSTLKTILDQRSGLALTLICIAVISSFILIAKPFSSQPAHNQTASTPTSSGVSMIHGTLSIICQKDQCQSDKLLSAYDIVIFLDGKEATPIAQSPVNQNGQFNLQVPTGTYIVKTIPELPNVSQIVTTQPDQTSNVNLTIQP